MLDVIFLSYHEPFADENFQNLLTYAPHAKRINGVKGILAAHQAAARKSMTGHFYVVDADAVVKDFWFDYAPSRTELYHNVPTTECVTCWSSINPVNGLQYGYGGVKLFPKQAVLDVTEWKIDLATSMGLPFRSIPSISNVTAFNSTALTAWRSAFRECAKLTAQLDSRDKIHTWCNTGQDALNGAYTIAGARAGTVYGLACNGNAEMLKLVNDFEWLDNEFKKQQY